jgi:protease-4
MGSLPRGGAATRAPGGWMPPAGGPGAMYQQMMQNPYGQGPPPPPPPPGAYPRRRGFRGWFVLLLIIALVGSWLYFLGSSSGSMSFASRQNIVDGDPTQKIAVIPVTDLITDQSASDFDQFLSLAEHDTSVRAVVLAIDTPGGSASASDTMFHRLMLFKTQTAAQKRTVPVVVAMGGMATSGGYYVACGADYIFARPATLTGNIGVLMPAYNFSKLLDKWGITEDTVVSSGTPFKNAGSMFSPERPQDRAYLQGLIDATFQQFKDVVMTGRNGKLVGQSPYENIFSGKAFSGSDALKLGLIDQIGYEDDAYAHAANLAKLTNMTVFRYQSNSLWKMLGMQSGIAPPAAQSKVTIDGISVDARTITDLLSPRPMFLWRGN